MKKLKKYIRELDEGPEIGLVVSGVVTLVTLLVVLGTLVPTISILIPVSVGIFFLGVLGLRGLFKKQYRRVDYELNLEKERRNQLEREELALKRKYVDLVIEKIEDKYRVLLKRGDGTIEYLSLNLNKLDFPQIKKPLNLFKFSSYESGITRFPECMLPQLKDIIQHYLKYGNLDPIPIVPVIIETFIVSRPPQEDPPDLTGIDTIHELAPLLIEYENNNDHKAVNKILDKMEVVKQQPLMIN